jgi:hypothetical protein
MSTNVTRNKTEDRGGQGAHRGHQEPGQFGGATEKARETASNLADKARDTASNLADKARETASGVAERTREMASGAAGAIGQKAEDAASSVGGGMKSLAETIRENAPSQGMLGTASARVAGVLEHSGRHLQEDGLSGIGEELTNMIRRNPIPSLLVGIGIGFLLARATRS